MITIVITMAGLGSRFREAGYNMPKYMIQAREKTLFEWSMLSLNEFIKKENKFIFVTRKEDNAKEFIKKNCQALGIDRNHTIELDSITDGQASTALLASKYWEKGTELLVYNIDTYIEKGGIKAADIHGDGFIPCFCGEGDHWSFVETDEFGKAVRVTEKVRISKYCTVGAYYFKSCELYERLYNDYFSNINNLINGEKYIAPLYNQLIKEGGEVYISNIDKLKIHVLGTPKELEVFIKS